MEFIHNVWLEAISIVLFSNAIFFFLHILAKPLALILNPKPLSGMDCADVEGLRDTTTVAHALLVAKEGILL